MSEVLREARIWVPLPTLVYQGRIASFDTDEWWRDIGKFLLEEAKGVELLEDRMGERSVDFERLMVFTKCGLLSFLLEQRRVLLSAVLAKPAKPVVCLSPILLIFPRKQLQVALKYDSISLMNLILRLVAQLLG